MYAFTTCHIAGWHNATIIQNHVDDIMYGQTVGGLKTSNNLLAVWRVRLKMNDTPIRTTSQINIFEILALQPQRQITLDV